MRKWLLGALTLSALAVAGIAAAGVTLHVVFSDVPGTAVYWLKVRQGPTPWAQVTPIPMGIPPIVAGNHATNTGVPQDTGTLECVAVAVDAAGRESAPSNMVSVALATFTGTPTNTPTYTPTSTPTYTATWTATASPTSTPTATITATATSTPSPIITPPILYQCAMLDVTHNGTVSSYDAAKSLQKGDVALAMGALRVSVGRDRCLG